MRIKMRWRKPRWVATTMLLSLCSPVLAQDHPGKGPIGHDNGVYLACTGPTGSVRAVICVRSGSGGDGSQATPIGSIQSAINAAKAGDVIAVAEGSYAESLVLGSDGAYSSKNISLLGGCASDFSSRDAATFVSTIDGGGLARAVTIFVQANAETRIDGFVIAQGVTTDPGGNGGGIRAELMGGGPLVISHNLVANNLTNPSASDVHGSMLDRLDSVTFAAPIFFHVVRFVFV